MSDIVQQVQDFYDEVGAHFSRTRQKTYGNGTSANWPVTDRYLKRLHAGQSVLDIGCGNGKLISGLPKGVSYTGTDFSKTLLSEAKTLYPNHDFHFANVIEDAYWQNLQHYDAIFCVAVLHHIPQKEQQLFLLSQARKHLKKGGFLYLSVWNLWQEKFAQAHLNSAKLKKTDKQWVEIPYNQKWKRFCVAFDSLSLTTLMSEAGWNIQELFYANREGQKSDIMHGQNLVCVARSH